MRALPPTSALLATSRVITNVREKKRGKTGADKTEEPVCTFGVGSPFSTPPGTIVLSGLGDNVGRTGRIKELLLRGIITWSRRASHVEGQFIGIGLQAVLFSI